MKIHKKGKFYRIRIKSPKLFIKSSFRTHDIGRVGHSKRIAGRLKSTGEWQTQTYLIPINEWNTSQAKNLLRQIREKHEGI